MSAPIDETRLAEIEARASAATPGPWTAVRERWGVWSGGNPHGTLEERWHVEGPTTEADADLMAHAREDVSALVAEVRRVTAELRDARADLDRVSFLRPLPSHRTGIRCARCGRDGGVDVGDDMPVCSWCSDAVTVECERDALRATIAEGGPQ